MHKGKEARQLRSLVSARNLPKRAEGQLRGIMLTTGLLALFMGTPAMPLHASDVPVGCEGSLPDPVRVLAEIDSINDTDVFRKKILESCGARRKWECILEVAKSESEDWARVKNALSARSFFDFSGSTGTNSTTELSQVVEPTCPIDRLLSRPKERLASISECRGILGKPTSQDAKKVPNQHDSSLGDVIKRISFPGVVAEFLNPSESDKELLLTFIMTKDQKGLSLPITIGASRELVLKKLGPPDFDYQDTLIYEAPTGSVNIQFKKTHISRIEWSYNVD